MPVTLLPLFALGTARVPAAAIDLSDDFDFTGALEVGGTGVAALSDLPGQGPVHDPVAIVATTNINLTSMPSTIGGISMTSGRRFAVVAQSDAEDNGIYSSNGVGSAATRADDFDDASEIGRGHMFVEEETGDLYVVTGFNGTLGTDAITIAKRIEGKVEYREDGTTSGTTIDLDYSDIDSTSVVVVVGGLTLRPGSGNDYEFSNNAGAGGVDRITLANDPGSVNYSVFYTRS